MIEPFALASAQPRNWADQAPERCSPGTETPEFTALLATVYGKELQTCPLLCFNPLPGSFLPSATAPAAPDIPTSTASKEEKSSRRIPAAPVAALAGAARALQDCNTAAPRSEENATEGADTARAQNANRLAFQTTCPPLAWPAIGANSSSMGLPLPESMSAPYLEEPPAAPLVAKISTAPESFAGSRAESIAALPKPAWAASKGMSHVLLPKATPPFAPARDTSITATALQALAPLWETNAPSLDTHRLLEMNLAQENPVVDADKTAYPGEPNLSDQPFTGTLHSAFVWPARLPELILSRPDTVWAPAVVEAPPPQAFVSVTQSDGLFVAPLGPAKELQRHEAKPAHPAAQEGQANAVNLPPTSEPFASVALNRDVADPVFLFTEALITEQAKEIKNSSPLSTGQIEQLGRPTPPAGVTGLSAPGDGARLQTLAFSPSSLQAGALPRSAPIPAAAAGAVEPQPSFAAAAFVSERSAEAPNPSPSPIAYAQPETLDFPGESEELPEETFPRLQASSPAVATLEAERLLRLARAEMFNKKTLRPAQCESFVEAHLKATDREGSQADILPHTHSAIKEQALATKESSALHYAAPTPPARLKLEVASAELGQTWLEVRQEGAAIQAVAVAENPQTAQLVQHTEERIRAALGELGLQLQGFSVSTGSGQQHQPAPYVSSPPGGLTNLLSSFGKEEARAREECLGASADWLSGRRIGHTVDYYA